MIDKVRQIYPPMLIAVGVILLVWGVLRWLNLVCEDPILPEGPLQCSIGPDVLPPLIPALSFCATMVSGIGKGDG